MKSSISGWVVLLSLGVLAVGPAIEEILRQQIIAGGFVKAQDLYRNPDQALAPVGAVVFKSKKLSLNGNISCETCHQDQFASADGIPNAAAIGGTGVGPQRLLSGAKLLPRRTLPLWGRGARNFDAFFWDGRVSIRNGKIFSQFGSAVPSHDLLVTADHLPVVEIREMLDDGDAFVEANKQESVQGAERVYPIIARNLRLGEPVAAARLAAYLRKPVSQLTYTDFARALAAFIRSKFRIKKTPLEEFVYDRKPLTDPQLRGALVFYGKGSCITCHSGPYFSDFGYHVVAFPQLGFGKNGFGIDYGRYNATFDPRDLYKFRTPPLFNVAKERFYGHSGSVDSVQEAIVAHYDPLSLVDVGRMTALQRNDFYKRLTLSQETANRVNFLTPDDVNNLAEFLKTLSF
jgi:cytochrome c peroxidase